MHKDRINWVDNDAARSRVLIIRWVARPNERDDSYKRLNLYSPVYWSCHYKDSVGITHLEENPLVVWPFGESEAFAHFDALIFD